VRAGVFPTDDLRALGFQLFIDREEVFDLQQDVRIQLGIVPHVLIDWIIRSNRENLFVFPSLVYHP